ncbi:MAG: hypothetical protein JKX76_00800 [Colwellia sp.]|nr:hypothetical protein [Colwellia sp.]
MENCIRHGHFFQSSKYKNNKLLEHHAIIAAKYGHLEVLKKYLRNHFGMCDNTGLKFGKVEKLNTIQENRRILEFYRRQKKYNRGYIPPKDQVVTYTGPDSLNNFYLPSSMESELFELLGKCMNMAASNNQLDILQWGIDGIIFYQRPYNHKPVFGPENQTTLFQVHRTNYTYQPPCTRFNYYRKEMIDIPRKTLNVQDDKAIPFKYKFYPTKKGMNYACKEGYVNVLSFINELSKQEMSPFREILPSPCGFYLAIKHGHNDVVDWCITHDIEPSTRAIFAACRNGIINILKHKYGPPLDKHYKLVIEKGILENIIIGGSIEIFDWFVNLPSHLYCNYDDYRTDADRNLYLMNGRFYTSLCTEDQYNKLYLCQNFLDNFENLCRVIYFAITNSKVEILEYVEKYTNEKLFIKNETMLHPNNTKFKLNIARISCFNKSFNEIVLKHRFSVEITIKYNRKKQFIDWAEAHGITY